MGVIVQELVTRLTELYYANVNYNIGNTKESKKKERTTEKIRNKYVKPDIKTPVKLSETDSNHKNNIKQICNH